MFGHNNDFCHNKHIKTFLTGCTILKLTAVEIKYKKIYIVNYNSAGQLL